MDRRYLTLDDGVRASTLTTPVLECWPQGMSSRERVARREAAAIADDKNMTLQVQNGVENNPALKRAR